MYEQKRHLASDKIFPCIIQTEKNKQINKRVFNYNHLCIIQVGYFYKFGRTDQLTLYVFHKQIVNVDSSTCSEKMSSIV